MRRRKPHDMYEYAEICKNYYADDNLWCATLTGGVSKDPPKEFYDNLLQAANAYGRVPNDKNATLLLGDTKIRSDAELTMNFGLSGFEGGDPDDDDFCKLILRRLGKKGPLTIDDLREYRARINAGQATAGKNGGLRGTPIPSQPHQPARPAGEDRSNDKPLFGPGSILSNTSWSPVLNDAFILAGLHTNLLFVLALNKDEQGKWANSKGIVFSENTKKYGGMTEDLKAKVPFQAWLAFMRDNPQMLWDADRQIPRVFLRELLGLKKFGYYPVFRELQLAFSCSETSKADDAMFLGYVEMLNELGFHKPKESKEKLNQAVAEFLFADQQALAGTWK
jgi:hypothetical protein